MACLSEPLQFPACACPQTWSSNAYHQAVDLVSYVEFQKNYRSLMGYHKAALEATRDFWRLVMRDAVPVRPGAAILGCMAAWV